MGEIMVVGPDAAAALDYALAGKLSAIVLGQAKYSLLLAGDGGVIDDLVIYRTGEERYMVVANASNRQTVAEELRARTASFEAKRCSMRATTSRSSPCRVPTHSRSQQTPGFGIQTQGNDEEDFVAALANLKYYRAIAAEYQGDPVLVARTGIPVKTASNSTAPPAGLPASGTPFARPVAPAWCRAGLASRDTLRLEAGMPLYGHELGRDILPVQAGLGRVVALAKEGDFVGRAAIEQGPQRMPRCWWGWPQRVAARRAPATRCSTAKGRMPRGSVS